MEAATIDRIDPKRAALRHLFRATLLLALPCAAACSAPAAVPAAPPEGNEADLGAELFTVRDLVGDGVFSAGVEGPATGPGGVLYAVSYGRDGTIGRVVPRADGSGDAGLFVELPEGSTGNGIRFGADGTMYVADYTGHNVLAVDPGTRVVRVFAHLEGAHQPNDLAMAPDGTLYASDPDWKNGSGQLWRIGRDGAVRRLGRRLGLSQRATPAQIAYAMPHEPALTQLLNGPLPANDAELASFARALGAILDRVDPLPPSEPTTPPVSTSDPTNHPDERPIQ